MRPIPMRPLRPLSKTSILSMALFLLAGSLLPAAPSFAWDLLDNPPREDFVAFHERFSTSAYFYPRHSAKPLGWVGFEIYGDISADVGFGDEDFARTTLDGDLPADALSLVRVGVRKGLPGGFDLGAAYGRSLGGDLELVSGELSWALVRGGALKPSLGFRLTGTQTLEDGLEAGSYDFDQYGLELIASKGFPLVTIFGGAGVVRSESTLENAFGSRLSDETTQEVYFAGVTLKLLLPRLTFSVEQGEELQGAVRLGFGF